MIEKFAIENNLKSYRIEQFNQMYYQKGVESFDELSTWSKDLREKLKKEVEFSTLKHIKDNYSSNKNTIKTEFTTKEGYPIESVLMQYKDGRNSVCVSCMSGCPVGCKFCATGQMSYTRNLTHREIIDQILHFQRMLAKKGKRVTNVVYMGMGEPMLNLENIIHSIEVVNDPQKLGIGSKRVTVSTVGYVPQLKEFVSRLPNIRIAISLHSPFQEIRESIMPTISKLHPIEELMEFARWYENTYHNRITYEYTLMKDVNDRAEDAIELTKILFRRNALVNIIKYNPSPFIKEFTPSNDVNTQRFIKILNERGISNTTRYSMGDKIGGACGQLHSINNIDS